MKRVLMALPDGGTGTAIPGATAPLDRAASYMVYIVLALCVFGLLLGFAKMAIAHNRREPADVSSLGMVVIAAIGALCATGIVTGIAG